MSIPKERIERVTNNLLPTTHLENQFGVPATLAERMAHCQTPGVSIAVINNYEIEWAQGFGFCQAGQPAPVTAETLFQAGSISKPIFALAVMRLVEQGILDLDEDVNNYLTSWQVPANGDWQPRLTLRQLLSHTAGLTVHGFPGYPNGQLIPTVTQVLNGEAPANTDPVRVNLLPGLHFRYAGGGTTVAQQVVVDLLGKPFPQIMDELVLQPAGATGSSYAQPPADWRERTATAHPWNGQPLACRFHLYPEMAAAGLWTTPTDLARLGLQMQRALRGDTDGLLKPETARQMLTPQTRADDEQIGIGFFLMGKETGARFGHGGWDEGFIAQLTLSREGGMGCAIMVNANQGHPLPHEIERAIAKEYNWPGYFPAQPTFSLAAEALAAYVGAYKTDTAAIFAITQADDGLWLHAPGQPAFPLRPTAAAQFALRAVNATLHFAQDEAGTVTTLTLHQEGRQLLMIKQI
ncbi:MAG: serine hydrolase domain-containing protein [Caldilineaceae bacterium]|jgi:CubicO group peptidase (beta-lactamase class C family)